MEEQVAYFLSCLYHKEFSVTQILSTLENLTDTYKLDKGSILRYFEQFERALPDPVWLSKNLNNLELYAPLKYYEGPKSFNFASIFHPISIVQAHQTPDSFTAIREFRNFIISASDDGAVKLFAQNNGILELRTLFVCKQPHKRQVTNMAVSSSLLVVVWGAILSIWDLRNYNPQEKYIANLACFKLQYAVKKRYYTRLIKVKDSANQIYIVTIEEEEYIVAQTSTTIFLIDPEKSLVFDLFSLGFTEREDKQRIIWASYCEKKKLIVFVCDIHHQLFLGFIDLNLLSNKPFLCFKNNVLFCKSDICGGSICFSQICNFSEVIYNKKYPVVPQVAIINNAGDKFAVSFTNLSAILLYSMPTIPVREFNTVDYEFCDLQLSPTILTISNVQIPAILKAASPVYNTTNLTFAQSDSVLVAETKVESPKFDKSFILFFNIEEGMLMNRCILQGTGAGISIANFATNGENYILLTDCESTGRDYLETIQLGRRDTFIYLLTEDGSQMLSAVHFPNGEEENLMVFCDLCCFDGRCYVSNACGQILSIGGDEFDQKTFDSIIQPEEEFFLIEMPAFSRLRFGETKESLEEPGKVILGVSTLLNGENCKIIGESCKMFNVKCSCELENGKTTEIANIGIFKQSVREFCFTGIRFEILRALFRSVLLVNKISEFPLDYYFGFRFLRKHNFHHNSYFLETINSICELCDPFAICSNLNKVYETMSTQRFRECEEFYLEDFYSSTSAENDYTDKNANSAHVITPSTSSKFGLLLIESFDKCTFDIDSPEYELHEGINYENKDEDDKYEILDEELIRLHNITNLNIDYYNENYKRIELPKYDTVDDANESVDDLREENSDSEDGKEINDVAGTDNSFAQSNSESNNQELPEAEVSQNSSNSTKVRVISDSDISESETSSSFSEDEYVSTAETSSQEVHMSTGPKLYKIYDKKPTYLDYIHDLNYNYVQSYNATTIEAYNSGLYGSIMIFAGDIVYLNKRLMKETTEAYREFFDLKIYKSIYESKNDTYEPGLYIVKSIYSRLVPHIMKIYKNKKIAYDQQLLILQDIELEPLLDSGNEFLNANANELFHANFVRSFDELRHEEQKNKSLQNLTVTIMPLARSHYEPELHATCGVVPIQYITQLSCFLNLNWRDSCKVFDKYAFRPEIEIENDILSDVAQVIKLDAIMELDSYTMTYRQPLERKFKEYNSIFNKGQVSLIPSDSQPCEIVPANFMYRQKYDAVKQVSENKPPNSTQLFSQVYSEIGKIINTYGNKAETGDYFEYFKRDQMENDKQFTQLLELVTPAVLALVEIIEAEDCMSLVAQDNLLVYARKFIDNISFNALSEIFTQNDMQIYNNELAEVLHDDVVSFFEQSMNEIRKVDNFLMSRNNESIGCITSEELKAIQSLILNEDLEKITAYKVKVNLSSKYLLEVDVSEPKIEATQDNSFAVNETGKLVLVKSQEFDFSLYNRSLLYFAFIRAMQSVVVKQQSPISIQTFFSSPVFIEDYLNVIATPVWINFILQRIIGGMYSSYEMLINDIQTLAGNSEIFNSRNETEEFIDMAIQLKNDLIEELNTIISYVYHISDRLLNMCCELEPDDDISSKSVDVEQQKEKGIDIKQKKEKAVNIKEKKQEIVTKDVPVKVPAKRGRKPGELSKKKPGKETKKKSAKWSNSFVVDEEDIYSSEEYFYEEEEGDEPDEIKESDDSTGYTDSSFEDTTAEDEDYSIEEVEEETSEES